MALIKLCFSPSATGLSKCKRGKLVPMITCDIDPTSILVVKTEQPTENPPEITTETLTVENCINESDCQLENGCLR